MGEAKVIRAGEKELYSNEKGSLKLIETLDIVNGKEIMKRFVREADSVTMIAMPSSDEVIMISNYRAAGLRRGSESDAFSYELPSGHLNDGEDPKAAANRELKEETGFSAGSLKEIASHYIGLYITTLKDHIFVATDLKKGDAKPEADEAITYEVVKVGDIPRMLQDGTIKDASSRDALMHYLMFERTEG